MQWNEWDIGMNTVHHSLVSGHDENELPADNASETRARLQVWLIMCINNLVGKSSPAWQKGSKACDILIKCITCITWLRGYGTHSMCIVHVLYCIVITMIHNANFMLHIYLTCLFHISYFLRAQDGHEKCVTHLPMGGNCYTKLPIAGCCSLQPKICQRAGRPEGEARVCQT